MSIRWRLGAAMLMLACLTLTPMFVAAESARTFRQQNGLLAHTPPNWFLEGYFIAREKKPGYVFGPVQDFVKTLRATTTWLIEDLEMKRLERASADGKRPEYSLYLEAVSSENTEYWVFVVLPHESAQAWFDARRAYHGRKAVGYYGKTQSEIERALSQGLKINAELRFLIEKGDISLQVPEDVIMSRYNVKPIFDLSAGRRIDPTSTTK